MSKIFVEQIDSSSNIVSTIFTSSVFTSIPLFIPWVQPPPIRKYRISFNGDSTSFLSNIIAYWRLEASEVTIPNYAQPSNEYSIGGFYNYGGGRTETYMGPPLTFMF